MTPHISAKKEEIAKTVLMPGDPLRAKYFAYKFLDDVKLVSDVRNMLIYTGTYYGKPVTIAASGMGQASMGIYSYELFAFYDVEQIIRIGTTGSYHQDLNPYDVVLVSEAFSPSTGYAQSILNIDQNLIKPSRELNFKLIDSAQKQDIQMVEGRVHCADAFSAYSMIPLERIIKETEAICVDMESYALFVNAIKLNKKAACLLTVGSSLITGEQTTVEEREEKFVEMLKIALEII